MRVAVMAASAVGAYFGARLAAAGHDVAFIARGAHRDAIRKDGLKIESTLGDLHLKRRLPLPQPRLLALELGFPGFDERRGERLGQLDVALAMRALNYRLRQRLLADGQRSSINGVHGGLPILLIRRPFEQVAVSKGETGVGEAQTLDFTDLEEGSGRP